MCRRLRQWKYLLLLSISRVSHSLDVTAKLIDTKSKDCKTLFKIAFFCGKILQIRSRFLFLIHCRPTTNADRVLITVSLPSAVAPKMVLRFGLCVASFFGDPSCRNLEGGPRHRGCPCPPLMASVTASQERVILSWRDEIRTR